MNKRTKIILSTLVIGLVGCGILSQKAQAVPITGSILFSGSAGASTNSGTHIQFSNPWHSVQGTGDYAGVPFGTPTTFTDFVYNGDGASATLTGPVTPIWTFTLGAVTYSFDLLQLTNGHTEPGSMSFAGTGIAYITGFDPTPATFSLQGAGNNFNFQLSSSSTTAQGVPEGGTAAALFALALVGLVALRRQLTA